MHLSIIGLSRVSYRSMIDLHSHSDFSDGELNPRNLVNLADKVGLSALALTDHDTLAGLDKAEKHCKKYGMRFIRGVETEVDFKPGEFHLLGLGLKKDSEGALSELLEDIRKRRTSRNEEMIALMNADSIPLSLTELQAMAGGDVIGRLHIARWFLKTGRAKNIPDVFSQFIGPGGPYYVPKHRPELEEAVKAIHAAGGKALIAHPLSLWVSWGRLAKLLPEWKEIGLDGLESRHSGASKREAARYEELGILHGMIFSGGSDYHGTGRPDRKLGRGAGGLKLSDEMLEPFIDV